MAKPVTGLTQFETNTTNSLVSLDANFTALANAINDPLSYSNYGIDSGAVNTLVLTLTNYNVSAYADGQAFFVRVGHTNTSTAVTLNINSFGTKTVYNIDGTAIAVGQLIANSTYLFVYNATLNSGAGGFQVTSAANAIPDLSVGPPAAGAALTVTAASGNNAITMTGPASSGGMSFSDGTVTAAFFPFTPTPAFYIGTTSNHALVLRSNATDRIVTSNIGAVNVNSPSSAATALTVTNTNSGSTAMSVTAAGIGQTAVFGNSSSDLSVALNGPTGFASTTQWQINSVIKGYIGLTGSAGNYVTGSSTNDFFIRSEGHNILLSISGNAATFEVTSGGVGQYNDGTTTAEIGWRILPENTQSSTYTLVLADSGRLINQGSGSAWTLTVPPNSSVNFPVGTVITVLVGVNGGAITIAQGAGVSIYWEGHANTTGSRVLSAVGKAVLIQQLTNTWTISGTSLA